jgi:hypothetical protein
MEHPKPAQCLFVKGSITNDIDLKRVFHEKPDYIFHLAAFFANQNSVDFPEKDLLVSQLGTVKMLEYAVLQGNLKRFRLCRLWLCHLWRCGPAAAQRRVHVDAFDDPVPNLKDGGRTVLQFLLAPLRPANRQNALF